MLREVCFNFKGFTVSVASLYLAGFLSLYNCIQCTVNMGPHTVDLL